jgi:hypothetical protein
MRNIVVSKFGNEPNLFGEDLRYGMLGEWECLKLLKILSEDKNNCITYYGKAKWDFNKACKYFNNKNVQYIESNATDNANDISSICAIDEFHIVLGPHAFYNGGQNIPSWESIKTSLVSERLLERVAPQIRLMNANPNAKIFFYLSDRRFLPQAADLDRLDFTVASQNIKPTFYDRCKFDNKDYSSLVFESVKIEPFRFETLWLYEKEHKKGSKKKEINLIIPANQVTSDSEIHNSRLNKIIEFTDFIDDYSVCGLWTNEKAKETFRSNSKRPQFLDGLGQGAYEYILERSKYALVLFNTEDSPEIFTDNWITVKYWECVYNGCITFVEATETKNSFIPEELQVFDGKELHDKIQRCESDIKYKNKLKTLQNNLVLPEYFNGEYYNTWLNSKRGE